MAVVVGIAILVGLGWVITLASRAKTGLRVAAADRIPHRMVIATVLRPTAAMDTVKRCARSFGLNDGGTFAETTFLDNSKGLRMDCVAHRRDDKTELVIVQSGVRRINGRPVKTGPMQNFLIALQREIVAADPRALISSFDS